MKLIRIINTIYGHRPAGSKYIQPKRACDPPFEVEDAEAERLVAMGVAVYAGKEPVATPPVKGYDTGTGENIPEGNIDSGGEEYVGKGGNEYQEDAETETGDADDGSGDDPDDGDSDGLVKPSYSIETKKPELCELMEQCGLQYKVGMTKVEMVAMLDEYFDGKVEDAEEPPSLDAEDPVI